MFKVNTEYKIKYCDRSFRKYTRGYITRREYVVYGIDETGIRRMLYYGENLSDCRKFLKSVSVSEQEG